MITTKEVTTRTLLRNFKEIKESLITRKVGSYQIEVGDDVIEMKLAKKKKGNIEAILKAAEQLPKDFKVERYNFDELEFFPKRAWKK